MTTLPHSSESEETLLGIAANYPAFIDKLHALPADAFYSARARRLRDLMVSLECPSPASVIAAMEAAGEIQRWGGMVEIEHALRLETAMLWPDAARDVLTAYRRRLLIQAGEKVLALARDRHADEGELIAGTDAACAEGTRSLLDTARHMRKIKEWMPDTWDAIEESLRSGREVTGIASGLPKLDRMTNGFQPGEMVVVGARPSCCKTILGTQFAVHAAQAGNHVAIFSREMRATALIRRAIHAQSGISNDLSEMRQRANIKSIMEASSALGALPITIDQTPTLTVESLCLKLRRLCRSEGVKLGVVDYLQMLTVECGRLDPYERVSYISARLKEAAGETGACLVVLAQLNRKGTDEPGIEHLRDSGQIEQDADVVLILNRPDKDETAEVEPFTIDIAKQRNGPTGLRDFQFRKECFRIEEPAGERSASWHEAA